MAIANFDDIDRFSRYSSASDSGMNRCTPMHRSLRTVNDHREGRLIGEPEGLDHQSQQPAKFIDADRSD
jgi:hypothetical protein